MAPGTALLLAATLAAGGVDVEAGLQAEARGRSISADGAEGTRSLEVATSPRLALLVDRPGGRLTVAWAARLVVPEVGPSARLDPWQELRLDGRQQVSPALRLDAGAAGTIGTTSPLGEAGRAGTTDPIPTGGRLRQFDLRLGAGAELRIGPTTTLTGAAGWRRSGGADRASRAILPLVSGAQVDVALRWRPGPRDEAGAALSYGDTRFDTGPRAAIALASARWRRFLQPGLAAWAGAGGGLVAISGLAGVPDRLHGTGLGEAGLEQVLQRPALTHQVVLRASPAIDRLAGTVDTRWEGEYAGALGATPGWRLGARGVAAHTARAEGTDRLVLVELRLSRGLFREISAWVGAYLNRQQTTDPSRPSLVEWGGLAGVEWQRRRPSGAEPARPAAP